MKKKILSALMAAAIMCTTLAGCKNEEPAGPVNENGDIQQEVELAQGEKENAAGLPTYDVGNLPVSQNICSMQQVNSIYVQQLDTRKAIAYNDLKNAILEAKESVKLSKQITEEELFQLMLILHSDDADVMYISTKYGYDEPINGYVEKVYLYYDYKLVSERRGDVTIATIKNNIYEKNQMAYSLAQDDGKSQTVATRRDNDFVAAKELMLISSDYKMDSREAALTYASMCRYIGIPAMVKIGKLTSDELSEYNGTTNDGFEFLSDVTKYTTKDENGICIVDYPTSDFVYWNLIQINGNWYNVDLKTNQYYVLKEDLDIESDTWFSFVPDYLISMSRISKYTEDLLGDVPASTDIQYNLTYRKNNFLLTHTESQIPIRLAEILDNIKADQRAANTIYQFEDEKTYESFIENIPQAVETYNEAYGGILLSYEVTTYKEALVVMIKNVKYKGNQ